MAEQHTIRSADAMIAFGETLGRSIRIPRVVTLSGDLGAGKTTLAKGLIFALTGVPTTEVTSPTFQYVQFYTRQDLTVVHFDLWRLHNLNEFLELGLEEHLAHDVVLIEWPDRIGTLIPQDALHIKTVVHEQGRLVYIS